MDEFNWDLTDENANKFFMIEDYYWSSYVKIFFLFARKIIIESYL